MPTPFAFSRLRQTRGGLTSAAVLLTALLLAGCDSGGTGGEEERADLLAPVTASLRADTTASGVPVFVASVTIAEDSPYTYDVIGFEGYMLFDGEDIDDFDGKEDESEEGRGFDMEFIGSTGPGDQKADTLALSVAARGTAIDSHDDYDCLGWFFSAADVEVSGAKSKEKYTCHD